MQHVYIHAKQVEFLLNYRSLTIEKENAFNGTAHAINEINICAMWVIAGEFRTTDRRVERK